jgi:hypothetical protein
MIWYSQLTYFSYNFLRNNYQIASQELMNYTSVKTDLKQSLGSKVSFLYKILHFTSFKSPLVLAMPIFRYHKIN